MDWINICHVLALSLTTQISIMLSFPLKMQESIFKYSLFYIPINIIPFLCVFKKNLVCHLLAAEWNYASLHKSLFFILTFKKYIYFLPCITFKLYRET